MRFAGRIIEYVRGKGAGAESIRYLIVGALTTVVNISLYGLMLEVFGIDVTISNVTSIAAAILFAYVANKLVVFRRHSGSLKMLALEFCKFVGSRLITMALEVGVVYLTHNVFGYSEWLGKYLAMVLVIITNYILSKALVFNNDAEGSMSAQDSAGDAQEMAADMPMSAEAQDMAQLRYEPGNNARGAPMAGGAQGITAGAQDIGMAGKPDV